MPNKIDDIELLLQSIKFDFSAIAITETWETNTNSSLLKLAGYVKVSKARTKQPGGGVALFLREGLKFQIKHIPTKTFESLFTNVTDLNGENTIIGVLYRPPGGYLATFNSELETILPLVAIKK